MDGFLIPAWVVSSNVKKFPVSSALGVCCAAAALFSYLHAPLPWMIGPLLAMAGGRFFGAHLAAPRGGRATGQLIIGCALGLYFTPAVAHEVATYWYLLIAAALFAVALAYASGWLLTWGVGLDATTALFASVPGGAAEMTILGERFGARPDRVVLAQSLRVVFVVVVVPSVFTILGVHGALLNQPAQLEPDIAGLAVLLAIAAVAGGILARLRVPNSWMLGPLAIAIGLTVAGIHLSAVPTVLSNAAQVLLGCALGSGFHRNSLRSSSRFVLFVLVSVVLAVIASALFAWTIAVATTLPLSTMVLATAPGGMAEMCVTAKVLQLGVPLVTAAHVTRVIILVTTTAPVFRIVKRMRWKVAR